MQPPQWGTVSWWGKCLNIFFQEELNTPEHIG
jgi:hypothetical protein